jgi:tetratricopeptide (TPR) repeat protein
MFKSVHKNLSLFLGLLLYTLITTNTVEAATKTDQQSKGIFYAQSYHDLWSELREFNQRQRDREKELARIERIRQAQESARALIPELERKGDYLTLAREWSTLEEWDKSLNAIEKAIVANPNIASGYMLRASLRKRLNDIPGTLADYDRAITINPNYYGYYQTRGELKKSFDRNGAIQDFRMAMKLVRVETRYNLIKDRMLNELVKELRSLGSTE